MEKHEDECRRIDRSRSKRERLSIHHRERVFRLTPREAEHAVGAICSKDAGRRSRRAELRQERASACAKVEDPAGIREWEALHERLRHRRNNRRPLLRGNAAAFSEYSDASEMQGSSGPLKLRNVNQLVRITYSITTRVSPPS